ncbi:MAG: hypothetical protein ABFR75_04810 [Acidobacteriota bacterium]
MVEETIRNDISYIKVDGQNKLNKVLIFLPGIGACKENYIEHLKSLDHYYSKLYSLDLPEQGSKGTWRIGNMVSNLNEFIKIIDDNSVHSIDLAGHSAGAIAILSFILSYNNSVEEKLCDLFLKSDRKNLINSVLENSEFGKSPPIIEKIGKLFLYAPPDSFGIVFPKKLSSSLSGVKEINLSKALNIIVNTPMAFFNLFTRNPYFEVKKNHLKKPQYFKLVVENHNLFFQYIFRYLTIFELYYFLNSELQELIRKKLSEKTILIQFGRLDWLIKPFFKRKKKLNDILGLSGKEKIKIHKFLGHLLNKRASLNINLNRQMITNPDVIKESIKYIKDQ